MRHTLALMAVFLAAAAPAAWRPARQVRASAIARPAPEVVRNAINASVDRGDVPGISAAVATRQGVEYQAAAGVADAATRTPMTTDAIFRIASMTKPITSVAVMQLVEQHLLSLDDRADKYLPELADLKVFERFDPATGAYTVRPAAKAVTVRQLLTHTSGLGYGFTSAVVRDFKPRDGERYAAGPLLFEPGTQWIYGTGIDWAGRIVEKITGKTLDECFRDRIFRPLGMGDTDFSVPDDKATRLVPVHRRRADGSFETAGNQRRSPVTGGGGLFSTARDYATFLQTMLNGGTLNGVRILSAESVRVMSENQIGQVGVRALESAQPEVSRDFSFIADRRDKWGIGFLISTSAEQGKRSAGSLSWGGIDNTYFWIDPRRGVGGVILMQFLPFADGKALAAYDAFERAVYLGSARKSAG